MPRQRRPPPLTYDDDDDHTHTTITTTPHTHTTTTTTIRLTDFKTFLLDVPCVVGTWPPDHPLIHSLPHPPTPTHPLIHPPTLSPTRSLAHPPLPPARPPPVSGINNGTIKGECYFTCAERYVELFLPCPIDPVGLID